MDKNRFVNRKQEVEYLKLSINELLKEMNISKRMFKKHLPRMAKSGYKYTLDQKGGYASLRQQYLFLKELKENFNPNKLNIEYKENENVNEK